MQPLRVRVEPHEVRLDVAVCEARDDGVERGNRRPVPDARATQVDLDGLEEAINARVDG